MRRHYLSLATAWVATGSIMVCAGCGSSQPPAADPPAAPAAQTAKPAGQADQASAAEAALSLPQPTTTNLWQAAERGNLDDIRIFLERGAVLGATNPRGKTALDLALANNHDEAAKLLMAHGAELSMPEKERPTPLVFVAKRGDLRLAKLLIECRAKVDQMDDIQRTPLVWAAEKGHAALVTLLLDHGADVNHKSHGNWTALHVAARDGHSEVVELLIKRQADAAAETLNRETPIMVALQAKKYETAGRIIELGGTVPPHPNSRGSWLAEAVTAGDVERVRFLAKHTGELEKGSDVVESTPLILAAEAGKTEIVRALLDAGANINAGTNRDWTSLHYAIQKGHAETAQLLVDRGADVTAKNNLGKSPPEMNADVKLKLPNR